MRLIETEINKKIGYKTEWRGSLLTRLIFEDEGRHYKDMKHSATNIVNCESLQLTLQRVEKLCNEDYNVLKKSATNFVRC